MTYAKHKTTQAEFVAAWWEAQDRKAREKLKRHYPGIEAVSFYGGMEYADKLRNIPNNALRRAGLKPRRRNGKRKKDTVCLSQASMTRILTSTDKTMQRAFRIELAKLTKQFADVGKMGVVFTDSHYREDALRQYFESEAAERHYLGRVMHYKNEPFLRLE